MSKLLTKRVMPVAELKARLSQALHDVERGERVQVARHGKVVAALVSAEDLRMLERLEAASPAGGLGELPGQWKGARALIEALSRD